jgi:hypothetical protein
MSGDIRGVRGYQKITGETGISVISGDMRISGDILGYQDIRECQGV